MIGQAPLILLWDLDYFYAENKKDIFDVELMKISSYYKQQHYETKLVQTEFDLNRNYELIFIYKNRNKNYPIPVRFYSDVRVKWGGKIFAVKRNWKMTNTILGCRPDYLLYPNKNTPWERAEFIQWYDPNGNKLSFVQDWTNTFKNKKIAVADSAFWFTTTENIISALKSLQQYKNIAFLEPIWIKKIIDNKDIRDEFFKLKLASNNRLQWTSIKLTDADKIIQFLKDFKQRWQHVKSGVIRINYQQYQNAHWQDKNIVYQDLETIKKLVLMAKKYKINLAIKMPKNEFDTPYYQLFKMLSIWTNYYNRRSLLEFLTIYYLKARSKMQMEELWNRPIKWNSHFKKYLSYFLNDTEFLLYKWGTKILSINQINLNLWKDILKYEI